MAEDQQARREEPIVIKKKRKHGRHAPHGGAWKVAYADFVTAMMALFIVLWILASDSQTKKMITAYFENPGAFSFITGKRTIPIDLKLQPSPGSTNGNDNNGNNKANVVLFKQSDTNEVVVKYVMQSVKDSVKAAEKVVQVENELKQYINEQISKRPEMREILSSIKLEMTKEGLRIELIESQEALFFEIGSAKLSKKAEEVLKVLAMEIGKLPNNVEIEGHTDSRKYTKQAAYQNWELSADRANSARRVLESSGMYQDQITRVTGFADRKLRTPENPFDISNRRVSILIKQLTSAEFLQNNKSVVKEN